MKMVPEILFHKSRENGSIVNNSAWFCFLIFYLYGDNLLIIPILCVGIVCPCSFNPSFVYFFICFQPLFSFPLSSQIKIINLLIYWEKVGGCLSDSCLEIFFLTCFLDRNSLEKQVTGTTSTST